MEKGKDIDSLLCLWTKKALSILVVNEGMSEKWEIVESIYYESFVVYEYAAWSLLEQRLQWGRVDAITI